MNIISEFLKDSKLYEELDIKDDIIPVPEKFLIKILVDMQQ